MYRTWKLGRLVVGLGVVTPSNDRSGLPVRRMRTSASYEAEIAELREQRRYRTRQVTCLEQELRAHGMPLPGHDAEHCPF